MMLVFEMLAGEFYLLSASMTNEPGEKSHRMKKKFSPAGALVFWGRL